MQKKLTTKITVTLAVYEFLLNLKFQSTKISSDQELIQSDLISKPHVTAIMFRFLSKQQVSRAAKSQSCAIPDTSMKLLRAFKLLSSTK